MICIYEHDCIDFATNGMGVLQPMSCEVTETLNGEWELELTHDIDDYGKWTLLQEGRILRVPVPAAMTPRMNQITQASGENSSGGGTSGSGAAMTELTASMGSYYQLVIKPSYKPLGGNNVQVHLSYGVRKTGANSATYNIDAAHMWASYNSTQVLGANGKHINWDQRQDPVGTYREYASADVNVEMGSTIKVYAKFSVGRVSAASDAEIDSSIVTREPPPRPSQDPAPIASARASSEETLIYKVSTQTDPLRLRSGTGTNSKILAMYSKGTEVIVVKQTTNDWYEVTCPDGKHGYMASAYLTYVRTENRQPPPKPDQQPAYQSSVIQPRQLRDQPFRIYRVVPELDKVTVYARHVFYDLMDNMIRSYKPSDTAKGYSVAVGLAAACESEHPFTFYSDLETTASEVEWENVNPVEAILGDGGMTEKYGAELARDWYDVFLVNRVGNDTDVEIRERKNLLGISYDVDDTDVATRIMPTGEDEEGNVLYLPELYLDSPHIHDYDHPRWIHLAVPDAKEKTKKEDEEKKAADDESDDDEDEVRTKEQCYEMMRKAAQEEFDKGCDLPTVTLKVDFVNCANTEEYSQYAALSDIFLGDSVRVVARRIGVEVYLRMTQYTYDCLTKKYTSITLGTAVDALDGTMISARQLANGSITGMKLALNSIGSGQLQSGSVGSLQIKMAAIGTAHIQEASIVRAHIAEALIDVLNVNALTAVSARIQELVAGNITTDELYAAIATIATAQITAVNIEKAEIKWADIEDLKAEIAKIAKAQINTANITEANIEWAQVENLSAELAAIAKAQLTTANITNAHIDWAEVVNLSAHIAEVAKAQITAASIDEAHIDWAAVTSLTSAVAAIVQASIGTADIDWAHIKDLATDTAIITKGLGGKLYIADLAVTEANMVNLTVGELVVKGEDGRFYAVTVDADGNVTTELKQIVNDDVEDRSIHGTQKLIEGSITTQVLNAQEIFAESELVQQLIAANIDVDTLFAREATINAINAMDIRGNEYLSLLVSNMVDRAEFNKRIAGFEEGLDELKEIGARNLLPNTQLMQPYMKYSAAKLDVDAEGFGVITLPALNAATYSNAIQTRNPIKYSIIQGLKVTLSFMVRSDDAAAINATADNGLAIELDLCGEEQYDGDGNLLEPVRSAYVRIPLYDKELSTDWQKVSWTGVVSPLLFTSRREKVIKDEDDSTKHYVTLRVESGHLVLAATDTPTDAVVTSDARFYVQIQDYSTGSIQVKKLKLELGAVPTDWSPSPEDVTSEIKEVREVGARNLLPNTRLMEPYTKYATATLDMDEEGFAVATIQGLLPLSYTNSIQTRNPIKYSGIRGQKVTLSFMVRSDDATAINAEVTNGLAVEMDLCGEEQYGEDGSLLEPTRTKFARINLFDLKLSTEWQKVTWTGVMTTSLFNGGSGHIEPGTRFYIQIQNYSNGSIQIKKLKMELGAVATDWSPAPEDISADLDAQGDLIADIQQSFAELQVLQNEITATVGEMREANEEGYGSLREYLESSVSQTASGLKIDIVKMLEQGIDTEGNIIAYKTTTGFSFDNSGLHISESGNGSITNDLTPTGMTVKRAGENVLVADASGVQATDVAVKNFLIMGKYSRFEDYSNGTDTHRTGCFYTGP